MLENIFSVVLNMSITASVAAVVIALFRWSLGKKLPAIFSYALWGIVLVRLLLPFSISSVFSIFNTIPVPDAIKSQSSQYPQSGVAANGFSGNKIDGSFSNEFNFSEALKNNVIEGSLPQADPTASADPIQILMFFVSLIWLAGTLALILFSLISYLRAISRLNDAVIYKNSDLLFKCSRILKLNRTVRIFTSDRVNTPVVCGLFRVRIILPLELIQRCNDLELKHIITHELVHIKRFDNILKLLAMLALCVHWFNPVMWICFILSQKDMEMSCDEKVISVFENDIRTEYASSLIKLASRQNVLLNSGLLAFGESNIKSRIKGIMNFRKPGFWLGTTTIIILAAVGILLLTNGQTKTFDNSGRDKSSYSGESENDSSKAAFDKSKLQDYGWLETVVINNCQSKDGPGEEYKDVGTLKYGEIVLATSRYNDWLLCSSGEGGQEYWVESANLLGEQQHIDYNLGIITANEVTVGTVSLKKGNLIQVLKRDSDRSCVTVRVIDINTGKTGWISNNDYIAANPDVYYNQAYLKKGTIIHEEPLESSPSVENYSGEYELFVNLEKEQEGWVYISTYGPVYGWVKKESIYFPDSTSYQGSSDAPNIGSGDTSGGGGSGNDQSQDNGGSGNGSADGNSQQNSGNGSNKQSGANTVDPVNFTDYKGNTISPLVTGKLRDKLQSSITAMKEMDPGVGPWRIIYSNGEKIILYNYSHIIACDISGKNSGIYSVIELKDLKVGYYQGSVVARICPSPDAMSCVIGAGCWEKDVNIDKSLYLCNFRDSTVTELKRNYNMANDKVTWYRNKSGTGLSPWYVSIKNKSGTLNWDAENAGWMKSIPSTAVMVPAEERFVENIDLDTGYYYLFWWKAYDNKVIGVPYSKESSNFGEQKLSGFEVIEVDLSDKTGKVLYKIVS